MGSVSTIAFVGGGGLTLAVALGMVKVKPWLFVAVGLAAVGYFTQPAAIPGIPGA
jgi:hypothetical protein